MAVTRAMARAMEAAANRHPQAVEAFKEGTGSILRQWTALELAVFHQWGGPTSKERAESLVLELLGMFTGPDKIYKDDVSLILEDYLETNFSTICEDGSPDELGDMLCIMWRQCCEGDFTMVTNALAREYVRHEMVTKSQGLAGGDAMDDSDEEDMEGGEGADDANQQVDQLARQTLRQQSGAADGQQMEAIQEEEEEVEPLVDAEGFQTVRGKKGKKSGKSYKI